MELAYGFTHPPAEIGCRLGRRRPKGVGATLKFATFGRQGSELSGAVVGGLSFIRPQSLEELRANGVIQVVVGETGDIDFPID